MPFFPLRSTHKRSRVKQAGSGKARTAQGHGAKDSRSRWKGVWSEEQLAETAWGEVMADFDFRYMTRLPSICVPGTRKFMFKANGQAKTLYRLPEMFYKV